MTRATDLIDLYQFEKHFEDASVSFFTSETGVSVYPSPSERTETGRKVLAKLAPSYGLSSEVSLNQEIL